ncbi:hypothetical protein LX32DRAFT_676668 [Colletotrichum zoysiae]|uniref:HNH nuclease domain-containing protein n=1 Tax=Colletotrichum zoysiae TaxID=1216348 RepID=A0AAD9H856_9PEZI|nr:hypothetical protein LX32DRAFT_676668 [Colletotrichum zoysiae]
MWPPPPAEVLFSSDEATDNCPYFIFVLFTLAELNLMYEDQSIRLRQLHEPAPENVCLEDYDEKMEILNFLAKASFVQAEREKAEPVKTFLINRFVWAAIWVAPALKRANYRCVLLGLYDPEVAHIYPHASIYLAGCCSLMRIRHIDAPENMISISCDIHLRMNNSKIALKPLEEISDKNELCLRLRHLKDSSLGPEKSHKSDYDTRAIPLNQDPKEVLKELLTHGGDKLELDFRNIQTGQRIRDGHVFSIKTNDPIHQPLPSIRIMQVYYRMAMMIRLAGAAEDDDGDDDDDDEDTPDTPSEGKLVSSPNRNLELCTPVR